MLMLIMLKFYFRYSWFLFFIFFNGFFCDTISVDKEDYKDRKEMKIFSLNTATTIVIGSGPGGLSSALYAKRFGGIVFVFEGENPGGQLMGTGIVENWPGIYNLSGPEIISESRKQVEQSGAYFISDSIKEIVTSEYPYKLVSNSGKVYYAYSIIISTGSSPRKLDCLGEEKFWGKGVSTCAICDAPLYKEKKVVVVGGGDSACEEAMQLATYAEIVYVLVRKDKMRASAVMQDRVKKNKRIKILYNTEIVSINGDKKVTSIKVKKNKNSEDLPVDGVFIAIGHIPNTQFIKDNIDCDESGLIICRGRTQETSIDGIYAVGDVSNDYRQAGVASGEGIKAAIEAYRFLQIKGIDDNFIENNFKFDESKNCENGICKLNFCKEGSTIRDELEFRNILKIKNMEDFFEFKEKLAEGPYLIDCGTSYCPSCRKIEKCLEKYLEEDESIPVLSIIIDLVDGAYDYFSDISAVPTVILINNKKEIDRFVGFKESKEIGNWVNDRI
jgi:thioredoxin reductase (NADPH)